MLNKSPFVPDPKLHTRSFWFNKVVKLPFTPVKSNIPGNLSVLVISPVHMSMLGVKVFKLTSSKEVREVVSGSV